MPPIDTVSICGVRTLKRRGSRSTIEAMAARGSTCDDWQQVDTILRRQSCALASLRRAVSRERRAIRMGECGCLALARIQDAGSLTLAINPERRKPRPVALVDSLA